MWGPQADEVFLAPDERPSRATGAAVGAAVGVLEACVPGTGGRVMAFVGGPCTRGPGAVVGPSKAEALRTHNVSRPSP